MDGEREREGGGGVGIQAYTLRERRLERSFGMHTGHSTAGNVKSFVAANHVTELKNSYFWTY
jgi:hypothetical protein